MIDDSILELQNEFIKIKHKGWIKGVESGTGSVGDTFENMLGLKKNNFDIPDFKGIEIKTNRKAKDCYITLFSSSCDGNKKYILYKIKEQFGWYDREFTGTKILRVKLSANKPTYLRNGISMILNVNYNEQRLYLEIYKYKKLVSNEAWWSFELLKNKLHKKLQYLAFIETDNSFANGNEYFKYKNICFYRNKGFDCFLNLLLQGIIILEIKFGIHRSGINIGKTYDHGSSFEIMRDDINKLFELLVY